MKLVSVERTDIAKIHHQLRHIPYQANRVLGVLSIMFNLAESWGLRPIQQPLPRREEVQGEKTGALP